MKRRLTWAKIDFLSLCPKGANRMAVVYKDDTTGQVSIVSLSKEGADFDEKGEILAVAYPANLRDAQGDISSEAVCKEMAYSFMKSGAKLDLRHNNDVLPAERAYVAENFIVQKSDARFHGWKDALGNSTDLTGSWGVVLKVGDPELRKRYRSGQWQGVSFEGRCGFEIEKEDQGETMDFAALLKAISEGNEKLAKSIVDQLKPAAPVPTDKKEDSAPVFKGDVTNVADLRKHAVALRRYKLLKSVDLGDADAVSAAIEQLEKDEALARKSETPEQKSERLEKENLELSTRLRKAEGASKQPVADSTTTMGDVAIGGATFSKADVDLGTAMADVANKRNGSFKK